jgi:multicomponent Na+:H+ antiporter subunit A
MAAPTAPTSDAPTMGSLARMAFTAVPLATLALPVLFLARGDAPLAWTYPWIPALGIDLAFRIDGLSALMLLLIGGIGVAVFAYAGGYLSGDPGQRRLFLGLVAFLAAMVGCVSADDLFVLFLFWELTSLTSFLLVGFHHEDASSRKAAQQALLVTGGGGLAMLAGFFVLRESFGTSSISAIVALAPAAEPTVALRTAVALVLVGAFTKSAQVPFHFWLPNAMAAPTPVSAYLHSATMVKLGVYLLARLDPAFGGWDEWRFTLESVGAVTAGWAMILALRERDLKRILAWSTVATLGTLVLLIGMQSDGAATAVAALLLAHALYKAPLFFVAGNVDHGTGTRIIDRLGNLRHAMPWTAAAALLAGLSMAGIPLTFGFIAKDVIHEAKAREDLLPFVSLAYGVFAAVAVAVAGVAAVRVFWWHPGATVTPEAHEGPPSLVVPPLALAVAGVTLGLVPALAWPLVNAAAAAMRPGGEPTPLPEAFDLQAMLGTLAMTLGLGAALYLSWDPLHRILDRIAGRFDGLSSAAHYRRVIEAIPRLAALNSRSLQHGRLSGYMTLLLFAAAVAFGGGTLAGGVPAWPAGEAPPLAFAGACGLVALGAILAIFPRNRLVLVLAAGLVGYGSALVFVLAGAPDVAFTQFTVETVFVVIVAAVLLKLKRLGRPAGIDEDRSRFLAVVVPALFATAVTAFFLSAAAGPLDRTLGERFGELSVPEAHGRNVVNVILVDFRALDTLGEASVIFLSLLAAMPLLASLRSAPAASPPGGGP